MIELEIDKKKNFFFTFHVMKEIKRTWSSAFGTDIRNVIYIASKVTLSSQD